MRYDAKPCILVIDAKMAWNEGIKFYLGNEKVWLADKIPGRYIRKMQYKLVIIFILIMQNIAGRFIQQIEKTGS